VLLLQFLQQRLGLGRPAGVSQVDGAPVVGALTQQLRHGVAPHRLHLPGGQEEPRSEAGGVQRREMQRP
jgi:hypothetical protein